MTGHLHYARCGHPVPPHWGPVRQACKACEPAAPDRGDRETYERPTRVDTHNQELPAAFAAYLLQLHESRDPRLNGTISALRAIGWTARGIGKALRVSGERVRQLSLGSAPCAFGAKLPAAPRLEDPPTPEPRWLPVAPEVAQELRRLHEVARWVNGGTAADDPRRATSVQLSALLAEQVRRGSSVSALARTIGVTPNAVTSRLRRHGFKTPAPSIRGQEYKGRGTWDR